jgi:hypothetical protein
MKFSRCNRPIHVFVLALSQVMGGAMLAGQPASGETPAVPAPAASQSPASPAVKSPVSYFRELLAMSPEDRAQALTNKTAESRRLILAKIREYSSLKKPEREQRLRATELEWRLVPLMKMPPTNRVAQLAGLPSEDRQLLEARLNEWDKLPQSVKNDLLAHRESIRLYVRMKSGLVSQTNATPQHGPAVEEDLKKLEAMPETERQKLIERFNQYFDLKPREQEKTLRALSPAEKDQITKSLDKFQHLTAAQRAQCIRSFEEFARMTPAERQQFMENASRWIMMPPEKRQAWRDVVEKISVGHEPFIKLPKARHSPAQTGEAVAATNSN